MTQARFIGDPRHGGQGPDAIEMFGVVFVKGEWSDVSEAVAARLSVNNHFEIDTNDDGEPGPTIEDLRAELDARGIKYHHKAGVKSLSALLSEANDEG